MTAGSVEQKLEGATFRGAKIEWPDEPPAEVGHWDSTQEGEPPVFIPSYCPPFDCTDLAGVSFEDVKFRNADFREAYTYSEVPIRWLVGSGGSHVRQR